MKISLASFVLVLGLALPLSAAELINSNTNSAPVSTSASASLRKVWPQDGSDLKADSNAIFGRLDNGLRYVIMPTKQAPTRASLRMYMDVGSLFEADDQCGMAHFFEHMAFNSTKHYPGTEKIEYLQRLGMGFGADTNAFTSFDQTVYKLELPRANEELTSDGIKLLRDYFDGMLLDAKEIDKERGVVLSEILSKDGPGYRTFVPSLEFSLPDTLVSSRMPVNDAPHVKSLKRDRFVDFYETWYTPARATIVATGDFDVKMVERLIRTTFADAKARRGEQPTPSFGKLVGGKGLVAKLHSDRDLAAVIVELSVAAPASTLPDSLARQREEFISSLTKPMLDRRLEKISKSENAPFQSASSGTSVEYNLAELTSLSAACQPAQWQAALGGLEQELRQALQFGFSETEFNEVKATMATLLKSYADQAASREPSELADEIVDSLSKKEVFVNPTDSLQFGTAILADLKKQDCEQYLHKMWDTPDVRIWVQGNLPLEGNASQQIIAAYQASQQQPVAALADEAAVKFAYTDFGPAGKIAARSDVKDLDFVQATFDNNVRVNIKRTPFDKSAVSVLIRFGGGQLELPAGKAGLAALAGGAFITGGVEAHTILDIQHILSDKNVTLRLSVGDDAFQFVGSCAPETLEMQLQLATAYLTAPAFRPEARTQFLQNLESAYTTLEHSAAGVLANQANAFLHCDDSRFIVPPREAMQKLSIDDLKAWMAAPLKSGYMEVTIVGDVDVDQTLSLVAKTIGTLPQRDASKPAFAKERQIKFPVTPKAKEFTFASDTPRAVSVVCWPTTGSRDVAQSHRLEILSSIIWDRLRVKVREELGATYTPSMASNTSETFPDYGVLQSELEVEPARLADVNKLVANIGNDLATHGISDDEFTRAIQPVLASLEHIDQQNVYWMYVLSSCQERPEILDNARGLLADYKAISKAQLESLAKKFLTSDKATILSISPIVAEPAAKVKAIPAALTR